MGRELAELVKGQRKIRLYRSGPHLSEMSMRRTTTVPTGKIVTVSHGSVPASVRAMEARISALEAEGWEDTGVGRVAPRREPAKPRGLEEAFGALARDTIAALGTSEDDARTWKKAIATYAALRKRAGGDPREHLVHFFAVDGVGLERAHPVVVTRAKGTAARKRAWLALLEKA